MLSGDLNVETEQLMQKVWQDDRDWILSKNYNVNKAEKAFLPLQARCLLTGTDG